MFKASVILLFAALGSASEEPKFVVPDFRDLTVKVRSTDGLMQSRITTSFFKGARERIEHGSESTRFPGPMAVQIMQCDLKTYYFLHPLWKTYLKHTEIVREDSVKPHPPLREGMGRTTSGFDVMVTVDSVDTGERRQMGSYEARRVTTAITVEPSPGATAKASKTQIDGWYIDLPGLNCREDDSLNPAADVGAIVFHPGSHNHVIVKHLGTAKRGFVVEQKSTRKETGNVFVRKTELLEFSEQPVDPTLFELPPDYSPATPGHQQAIGPMLGSEGSVLRRVPH